VGEFGTWGRGIVDFTGFPTSEDLIKIKVASSSDSEVYVSSEWLWISSTNFPVHLSLTFSGVDDTLVDGDENITITVGPIYSDDGTLLSSLNRTTWIVNRDNDISVSWTSDFISENGSVNNIGVEIPASTENVISLTHTQVTKLQFLMKARLMWRSTTHQMEDWLHPLILRFCPIYRLE